MDVYLVLQLAPEELYCNGFCGVYSTKEQAILECEERLRQLCEEQIVHYYFDTLIEGSEEGKFLIIKTLLI